MVLAQMKIRQLKEEGRKEGRKEGQEELQELWESWNKRREEAFANNQPFDEPPPSLPQKT
jgi:flagellar biosynthesis/type III secretory pathway protein FliH